MIGLSDLLRSSAAAHPQRAALIDRDSRFDLTTLDDAVTSAALGFVAAGLEPGARVALQLPTGADFVILYLGALRAGLVAVPVNPAYAQREVDHVVGDAQVSLHLEAESGRAFLTSAPLGEDPRRDRGGEDLAVLLYTSGTSGLAKGAMLPARALLANLDQLASVEPPLLTADDVLFLPLPLSHIFGLNAGLGMALRTGATLVVSDRFDAGDTLATMAREKVTAVLGVPGQYAAWLAHPDMGVGFASVRFAMSGSTTLARGVVEGFAAAGVTLHDGYGLTEAAPVVTINALGAGREHPVIGSIGTPLPGIEVELRDTEDGGAELADDGDPGRIFIRGENLFAGYWPDRTNGPDPDGWFGTGDVAVRDELDQLHLVGHSTDLVIVNGFNVYPVEVESVLAKHPSVAEVAVIGAREPTGASEQIRAYVVPANSAILAPDELLAWAAGALARFKLPREIEIVETLPHTVTGKIMKWQVAGVTD